MQDLEANDLIVHTLWRIEQARGPLGEKPVAIDLEPPLYDAVTTAMRKSCPLGMGNVIALRPVLNEVALRRAEPRMRVLP